jgi:hypothetical protein
MFQTNVVETIKTHVLRSVMLFTKNRAVYEMLKNTVRAGQATDDNMAYAHYMLDT